MIFIDPTEGDSDTRLPALPGAIVLPGLEQATGADLLLSPLDVPASTDTLLRKHVAAGALLVQRKSGGDLVHSVGDRLTSSLARMHTYTGRPAQRVLLCTGTLTCAPDGAALIDGREAMGKFWAVSAALARWGDRGGVVCTLPNDSLIPAWVEMRLKHLREYAGPGGELRQVYPPNDYPMDPPALDDPLQLPILVRDGRVILAQLTGIGPKLAERIWTMCGKNLGWALTLLTDEASPDLFKIPGIGVTTIRNIRTQMGLEANARLHLLTTDDVVLDFQPLQGVQHAIQSSVTN